MGIYYPVIFSLFISTFFSWVTRSFESDVNDQAVEKFDSLTQNAIPYFTLNGDTLIVDGNSKKEKQQIVSYYEQNFYQTIRCSCLPCN